MARTAVVLFNLGGPDSLRAVKPFLFNLFNDPAIIRAPGPIRWLLARGISRRRAPVASAIYSKLGCKSPILAETEAQARALEAAIANFGANSGREGGEVRVFIAMRHWHPMSEATAAEVKAWGADEIVLLPLYPQFSSTTTASSLAEWGRAAARVGLRAPSRAICCYPAEAGFIEAHAALIAPLLAKAARDRPARLLFSAHGLPEKIVRAGDPYQWQVERTAAAVAARLEGGALSGASLDWRLCYQSRVGRLVWIGPSTEAEIGQAGQDGVALVVVPIAFVSEHSETLVELDIEYRDLAKAAGVPAFHRVPALGTGADFIASLAELVRARLQTPENDVGSGAGRRLCPAGFSACPMHITS